MPPRQRLVRKQPLLARIRGALSPSDFLLWASEEIKTRDLDAKPVGTRLALFCNFAFLLARANSGATTTGDDVFAEARFSWVTLFVRLRPLLPQCGIGAALAYMRRSLLTSTCCYLPGQAAGLAALDRLHRQRRRSHVPEAPLSAV
jgi:hypothetical protein